MKKIGMILIAVFLISASSSFRPAGAQEKSKEDKERELRIQEEIDQQKKEMEQSQVKQEAAIKEQQEAVNEAMRNAKEQLDAAGKYQDVVKELHGKRMRPFNTGEPFLFYPGVDNFFGHSFGDNTERTTWDFSKSVKENSFSRDYTFDVESSVSTVVMSVNGDCKAGEIRIKIVTPGGKTYSDIVIDEFGDLNWRKTFTISEEENQDKAGAWKFQINASKATGFFKISLQTY